MPRRFRVLHCPGQKQSGPPRPIVPRAKQFARRKLNKKTINKYTKFKSQAPRTAPNSKSGVSVNRPSVLDMLLMKRPSLAEGAGASHYVWRGQAPQEAQELVAHVDEVSPMREPREPIVDIDLYIEQIKLNISRKNIDFGDTPWVRPANPFTEAEVINAKRVANGERQINACEALNLVLRPLIFVWAPDALFPKVHILCPECSTPMDDARWWRARLLHGVDSEHVYITKKYRCCKCLSKTSRSRRTFMADSREILSSLPEHVKSQWDFIDTGRIICDAPLLDLIRAMGIRASWSSIADTINEIKETSWTKKVTLRYLKLCEFLKIHPINIPSELPAPHNLHAEWVRNAFNSDYQKREYDVIQELSTERGDEVLVFDWTKQAATRCRGGFMFNVMSGDRKILASVITNTSVPHEVKQIMWDLKHRGVQPKLVYVDDECCGEWNRFLPKVWPGVRVRLDGLHAIMRLTQTTTSTQHPWHGTFCSMLSNAIYTYDQKELKRLQEARKRAGLSSVLPKGMKSKYVPRVVLDAHQIAISVNNVIEFFANRMHEEMGSLLTSATHSAWEHLKRHVQAGCLCDPPNMNMNTYRECENVTIGGEVFKSIRSLRGTSALEGFHCHQKSWLGAFGRHAMDAGLSLLADGSLRWNRKRHNESNPAIITPMVFASGLLQEANELHQRLVGSKLYSKIFASTAMASNSPICCLTFPDARTQPRQCATGLALNVATGLHCKAQLQIEDRENKPQIVRASRAVCHQCHMVGTRCRLYKRIQWCEAHDVPFSEWVADVFPQKKADSCAASAKRANGVGGRDEKFKK